MGTLRWKMAAVLAACALGPPSVPASARMTRVEETPWRIEVGSTRVIGLNDLVVGKMFDGRSTELLVEGGTLIRIDLQSSRAEPIGLSGMRPTDRPWGAALLEDGTRWTLLDRWTLALFSRDGRITSRHPLARPHIGLYGLGTRLLYQAFETDPRRLGVSLGEPGNLHRQLLPIAASRITTDAATTRVRNLLACGTTVWPVLPCWLSNDSQVRLVRETSAIDVLTFEAARIRTRLGGNTSLRLSIRDASIDQAHHIWVLWDVVNSSRRRE